LEELEAENPREGNTFQSEEIILIPSEDGEITEEDSGEENEADISHLPPRILRSHVEINNRIETSDINVRRNFKI
jgi:hypothetical protein